jgi:hypothetical protein
MDQIHKVAALLHLLSCKEKHNELGCQWYIEGQQAEALELPTHQMWEGKVKDLLALGGVSLDQLQQALYRLFTLTGDVKNFEKEFPCFHPLLQATIESVLNI